ncbi:ESPR-type extended signal peptide-containing protein [Mannheimia indoligenes]|uniref:ESPR-type extended signal peptide-containing protein n=1 Tax=Mannheimia indoligenes TaxID=3103145 RepID=UPI002FE681AA
MNKIYRVIWNNATHCWQAVSELTKGHYKSSSSKTSVKEQIKELLPATISFSLTAFALQAFILFGAMPINDAYAAQTQGTCVQSTKFSLGPVNIAGVTATSFNNAMNNPTFVAIGGCISSSQSPTVNGRNSIAIGPESSVKGRDGYAIGTGARVDIIGSDNDAQAGAIALGNKTYARGQGAVAIGGTFEGGEEGAKADSTNAIAIGHNSQASHNHSIALGSSSKTGGGKQQLV